MSKKTAEKPKPVRIPRGLVALALSLQGSTESEPLKAFAAAVVSAIDEPAPVMRRLVIKAAEELRDA